MKRPQRSEAELRDAIASPSFTPGARDVEPLLGLLSGPDDDVASAALHALVRGPALAVARKRFDGSKAPLRGRLCELVARIADREPNEDARAWLETRLRDEDSVVRRRAARALGRQGAPESERVLIQALGVATSDAERKAIVQALGNLGGEKSLVALDSLGTATGELARVTGEARTKLERTRVRAVATLLDDRASPREASTLLLHVRAGLEPILLSELTPKLEARKTGRGRVAITLGGPLSVIWRARTFLHCGFPLPPEHVSGGGELGFEAAVVRALTSDDAMAIFKTWTRGPIRWRLEWANAGHRRAGTLRVARAIAARRPELVNDPREAPWEAVVHEREDRVNVELWPSGLVDPRFAYRVQTVPASSHPTIAAALARVGGAKHDDVVWDPFVGAGAELVERARLGAYRELIGSDTDSTALAAAEANVSAAGLARVRLRRADARVFVPGRPVSLVITNPPMGRRIPNEGKGEKLLLSVLARVAAVLVQGGRFVWMSPRPELTAKRAAEHGLVLRERHSVDMGGLAVEMQMFVKAAPPAEERSAATRRPPARPRAKSA